MSALHPAKDIMLASDVRVFSARVLSGATLASILDAHGVAVADVKEIVERAGAMFDLRKVRQDQPYRLESWIDGTVRQFLYEIDGDRFLRVSRAPAGDLDGERGADREDASGRDYPRPHRP